MCARAREASWLIFPTIRSSIGNSSVVHLLSEHKLVDGINAWSPDFSYEQWLKTYLCLWQSLINPLYSYFCRICGAVPSPLRRGGRLPPHHRRYEGVCGREQYQTYHQGGVEKWWGKKVFFSILYSSALGLVIWGGGVLMYFALMLFFNLIA